MNEGERPSLDESSSPAYFGPTRTEARHSRSHVIPQRFAALFIVIVVASAVIVEVRAGVSVTNNLRSQSNVESLVPPGTPVWPAIERRMELPKPSL
jgi:hypothetical protein